MNLQKALKRTVCSDLCVAFNDFFQSSVQPMAASRNSLLRNAFEVLTYHRHRCPHLMGASVLGFDGVFDRLAAFKKTQHPTSTQFFMAKVDVQSCFNSIPHGAMMQVVSDLLLREDFIVHKFDQIRRTSDGRLRKRFLRKAYLAGDLQPFGSWSSLWSGGGEKSIYIDKVRPNVFHSLLRKGCWAIL